MASDREKILQSAQRYVDRKKYDRAIAEYERLVEQDPNDARTLLKIGDLQARLHAYPEAIATYDRVGQFYGSHGFAQKAIAVYKQIRELIRKHAPQLTDRYGHIVPRLAEIYTQLGLTSEALQAYDEVATHLQKTGRDRDAIDIFYKMVELDAGNPLPHLRLAEACCRVQNVDDAIESFWTAADLLLGMDRPDDALKVVERILHFRQDPRFARVAAELYLRQNSREAGLQALSKLQICFQANPKDLDTLALLAQAFTTIGQQGKAIEVYKEMARTAREHNEQDMFRQLLDHLREVAPDDEQVRALESLPPPPPMPPPAPRSRPPTTGSQSTATQPRLGTSAPPAAATSTAEIVDDDIELLEDDIELLAEQPASKRPAEPLGPPERFSAPDVMIVDEDIEPVSPSEAAAAKAPGEGVFDASAHARKAIVDAESFRKLRLYAKAIEALRMALDIDPDSLEIRFKLRELFVEAGDREWAIAETLNIARIYTERGENDLAEPLLYEILEIEPEHAEVLELLESIAPGSTADLRVEAQQQAVPTDSATEQMASGNAPANDMGQLDSPFGGNTNPGGSLPSLPVADSDDIMAGLPTDAGAFTQEQPGEEPPDEYLREALDEAEFFASRGLHEDARIILKEQLARLPENKLLLRKLREVDQLVARTESKTIERSQLKPSVRPKSDRAFDIAASLEALDELEQADDQHAASGDLAGADGEVDVDRVFEKFKEGVRAQVSEADSSTHYDLGVAYKEMGLIKDAIGEFELAGQDPQRTCMCFAMIGMIRLEQRDLDAAIDAYLKALATANRTVEQELGLYYDLGHVYEMKGEPKQALYYFQKVMRRDPGYREVKERIQALHVKSSPSSAARTINNEDEFDHVFDDLFDSS